MSVGQVLRKSVCGVIVFAIILCPVAFAREQARVQSDPILDIVRADCLFCVKISNFNDSIGLLGKYVGGTTPLPLPLIARGPLAQLLGDPELKNIDMNGDFAVFAVARSGRRDAAITPDNVMIAGLIPVTDYAKFVGENATCGKPDDQGISTTKPANGGQSLFIKQVGAFALVSPADNARRFAGLGRALSQGKAKKLSSVVRGPAARAAGKAPFWVYGNVELAGKVFGPVVFGQIEAMKEQIKKMNPGQVGSPADFMDFYVEMFKVFFDQVGHVTVSLTPKDDVAVVSMNVSAVKGKELAEMLTPLETAGKVNPLLGYLEDGAMINVAGGIDKASAKKLYGYLYDLFPAMSQGAISGETLEKLKKITVDEVDSFGDFAAFSMSADGKVRPPFKMAYVVEVSDAAKLEKVLDESMKMINEGAFADMYKSMGMKIELKMEMAVAKYKGVSIDSAKMKIGVKDKDSEMGKAITAMYGDGFDYHWAIVDGLAVYSMGPDSGQHIKELIDQVKANQGKKIGAEMKAALKMLPSARRADAVGTFNFIRMMKMGMGMAKGIVPEGTPIPQIDTPTESNIVFSVKGLRGGSVKIDIAIPQKHLVEIQMAVAKLATPPMNEQKKKQPPAPKAEEIKEDVVAADAEVKKVADGFAFTEGPVSDAEGNLYFSDIPNNRVHKVALDGKVTVFLENTGGANGLFFDKEGRLFACAGGDRVVYRITKDGREVVAREYGGKKLNSPNDLWIDAKGGIYFTDPRYGGRKEDMEQDGEHVYYIRPDKKIVMVTDDLVRPNGVIGSKDGKTLYIADHGDSKTWSYRIKEDGALGDKELFAEEGSDGMTIDSDGNIYLTNNAVKVYCCKGNKIATIEIPEGPANVTFGGADKKTLFVTARKSLYSVRMNVKGI